PTSTATRPTSTATRPTSTATRPTSTATRPTSTATRPTSTATRPASTTIRSTTSITRPTTSTTFVTSSTTRPWVSTSRSTSFPVSTRTTSRSSTKLTSTRPTTYYPWSIDCYYCSALNCPTPFNSMSASVELEHSRNGWCVKSSSIKSQESFYSRGADLYNVCSVTGCSWKTVGGLRTWVCCCNKSLCNGGISLLQSNSIIILLSLSIIFSLEKFL
ncbi:unnamed protein product, partial [Adineta ricciae]